MEKYKYIAETDVLKRLKFILMDINQQKMIVELEAKINEEVKKAIDENQKGVINRVFGVAEENVDLVRPITTVND